MRRSFTDALGRLTEIAFPPRRIVSLCPSQTELLADLGLMDELVGRTRFCIHPAGILGDVLAVGGTKDPSREKIASLQPDLIIGEKEENTEESIRLLSAEFPVYVTDVHDFHSALQMILSLGELTGKSAEARMMADDIRNRWSALPRTSPLRTAYLIWKKPWMGAGRDTYIDSVLERAGLVNVLRDLPGRYPVITEDDLHRLKPERILLSSEPYPFREKHQVELQALFPESRVMIVDGEMFSWYGSRMRLAANYLKDWIHEVS